MLPLIHSFFITVSLHEDVEDYEEIIKSKNPLIPFSEDLATHRQCFNISITDDKTLEDTEKFYLYIGLVGDSTHPVMVAPSISLVQIMDNECELLYL